MKLPSFIFKCQIKGCQEKATRWWMDSIQPIYCDAHHDELKKMVQQTLDYIQKMDEEYEKHPEKFDWR